MCVWYYGNMYVFRLDSRKSELVAREKGNASQPVSRLRRDSLKVCVLAMWMCFVRMTRDFVHVISFDLFPEISFSKSDAKIVLHFDWCTCSCCICSTVIKHQWIGFLLLMMTIAEKFKALRRTGHILLDGYCYSIIQIYWHIMLWFRKKRSPKLYKYFTNGT